MTLATTTNNKKVIRMLRRISPSPAQLVNSFDSESGFGEQRASDAEVHCTCWQETTYVSQPKLLENRACGLIDDSDINPTALILPKGN